MKNLKMLIVILIPIIVLSFSSCTSFVNPQEEKFKDVVYEEYEALIDAFLDVSRISDISDYIFLWGNSHGFVTKKDSSGSVIIRNNSENLKEEPSVHLSCDFTIPNRVKDFEAVAFLMGALKETYGDKVLEASFVPYKPGDYYGAGSISSNYFKRDVFIHLNTNVPNEVVLEENSVYQVGISRSIKQVKPTCSIAYTLSMEGMPSVYAQELGNNIMNPAKELGIFFSNLRTDGVLFDLKEMNTDQTSKDDGYFSYTNTVVKFLITQNDVKNLDKAFQRFKQNIIKENLPYNPDIQVELIEDEFFPEKVISHKDKDDILNFLYTVFTGVGDIDDEEMTSVITSIALDEKGFKLGLRLTSSTDLDKEALLENVKASSLLSEMKFDYKMMRAGFKQDTEIEWISTFLNRASHIAPSQSADSPLSIYKKRFKNLDLVSYGVSIKDVEKQWNILEDILDGL